MTTTTRPFRHGPLTADTAVRIAQRIGEMLAGKLLAVCSVGPDDLDRPRLELGNFLQNDWTDNEPVLIRVEPEKGSICFADGSYIFTYNALNPNSLTKFVFDRDEFLITDPLPDGGVRKLVFKVMGDLPVDTDEYHLRDLAVHLTLAGRTDELTDELTAALRGQVPRLHDYDDRNEN